MFCDQAKYWPIRITDGETEPIKMREKINITKVFFVHLKNRLKQNFLGVAGEKKKDDVFITKECE